MLSEKWKCFEMVIYYTGISSKILVKPLIIEQYYLCLFYNQWLYIT